MADELGAELSLDLDAARREVESFRRDVEDELERAVSTFGDAYSDTVRGLPSIEPEIDVQSVNEQLEQAIQSVDANLAVTPNVDALQTEISDALAATDAPLNIDTDAAVAQIEGLFDSFHPEITPEIDTTDITASLDSLAGATGGLGDAQDQVDDFNDSLSEIPDSAQEGGDALGNVSNVSTTLATAFSAAKGEGRQLISQLGRLPGGLGPVVAGTAAVTAGFTALFAAGERSLASVERAETVLGDAAGRLETINVGGLSGGLGDLAVKAGVSGGALRNAATNAAQMGLASGKSKTEVTAFANNVNALALRAVALNPALGEAGSVAERLNLVLSRGGRFLARYGLDLTAAEITARALAETGKTTARDLTVFERSVAGADLAVEKLGNNLGADFDRGAATATVRLKSVRAELNAAFASAGRPLVEPTIDALEGLADAGTDVSKALGSLAKAALPVFTTGLESLASVAGAAGAAMNTIPGPVLAAAAALFVLDRATGRIRSTQDLFAELVHGAGAMDSIATKSIVALGALTALDQGLKLLGTSTKELGVDMVTTGAAIGFAVGGLQGAALGAGVGAIIQVVAAESDLQKATEDVDKQFQDAKDSSGDLRAALFANADTAVALGAAISGLDTNLAEFIAHASAFKGLHLEDDLRSIGLGANDVARLAEAGDAGFTRFIDRAEQAGKVTLDLGAIFADQANRVANQHGLDEATQRLVSNAAETGKSIGRLDPLVDAVRDRLDKLGVSAQLTGTDFVNLTDAQQRNVLIALRQGGVNTKLIVAFKTLQDQLNAAGREQVDFFATTNHLSPAIVQVAKATDLAENGHRDWTRVLALLRDAAVGLIPELGRVTAQTAAMLRETSQISTALKDASATIPTFGSSLSKALDTSFLTGANTLSGEDFLDTSKLVQTLGGTEQDINKFFTNVQTITEAGASNAAAALLALGPDNLGARVAAEIAANEPLFRDAMEHALSGIANAQLASEATLDEMRGRIAFLSSTLGTDLEEQLKIAFGTADITQIQTPQLVAFFQRFPALGTQASKDLIDAFNREQVAKKIAGFDLGPVQEGIEKAKESLRGANLNNDIDVALQAAQATTAAKAPAVFAPIPGAILAVKPEVVAGIGQIGDIIATGTTKTKDQYDAEFRKIVGITTDIMGNAKRAAEAGGPPLGDATARSVTEAIDAAENAIGDRPAQLGFRIIGGIAYGITNSDADERALQEHIDELLDQAAGPKGIDGHSPSRRFEPIGTRIVDGIARGISNATSVEDALAEKFSSASRFSSGFGGFGTNPSPPSGLQPIIQVMLDSSALGSSIDSSIHVGAVHNYGPDIDSRGQGMVGVLRDLQFTGGSI